MAKPFGTKNTNTYGHCLLTAICKFCKKSFTYYKSKGCGKFCSRKCYRNAKKNLTPYGHCKLCGKTLRYHYEGVKYCSRKCMGLDPDYRENDRIRNKLHPTRSCLGRVMPEEEKQRKSLKMKGRPCYVSWKGGHRSEITIEKIRKARLRQVIPFYRTKIELKAEESLIKHSITFISQQHIEECTIPDQIISERKIAIYEDGCYWHGCSEHFPERKRKVDDAITNYLIKKGWRVFRFWEHDINKNPDIVGLTIEQELKKEVCKVEV